MRSDWCRRDSEGPLLLSLGNPGHRGNNALKLRRKSSGSTTKVPGEEAEFDFPGVGSRERDLLGHEPGERFHGLPSASNWMYY